MKEEKRNALLRHSLLKQRIAARFANDQIGPLHNYNRNEKGCVACIFKNLSLLIGPLLAVGVLEVVDRLGVPGLTNT